MVETKYDAILNTIASGYLTGEITYEQAEEAAAKAEELYGDRYGTEADAGGRNPAKVMLAAAGVAAGVAAVGKFISDSKNKKENFKNYPQLKKIYDEMANKQKAIEDMKKELTKCHNDLARSIEDYNQVAKVAGSPTITIRSEFYVPYNEYNTALNRVEQKEQRLAGNSLNIANRNYNPEVALRAKRALNEVKQNMDEISKCTAQLQSELVAFNRAKTQFNKLIKKKAVMDDDKHRTAIKSASKDLNKFKTKTYGDKIKAARSTVSKIDKDLIQGVGGNG